MKKKQKGKGGKADVEMKDEPKDTNGGTANGKPNENSNGTTTKENTNGINVSEMKAQERSSPPMEYKEGMDLLFMMSLIEYFSRSPRYSLLVGQKLLRYKSDSRHN